MASLPESVPHVRTAPARHRRLRVLYSFPNRIGGARICTTAWHQVHGLIQAGADVTVLTGSVARPLPGARVRTTLALSRMRLPLKVLGVARTSRWHDRLVARWLARHAHQIDLVHAWPSAALETIGVARRQGIPILLERPNAHTAFACEVVAAECRRLGMILPPGSEHALPPDQLAWEEREFRRTDFLLCPSEFVAQTFVDQGYPRAKLLRHHYGYDETRFRPGDQDGRADRGLVMLYAGVGTPRKGLHHALRAWLDSGAQERGTFLVCGDLLPEYRDRIEPLLQHPSIRILGQQAGIADIMRQADLFVLPTLEEGSALVTYEARGSGCVLLVSDASGAVCRPGVDSLVHAVGDVRRLSDQIGRLDRHRESLARLRAASLATVDQITWSAAGRRLLDVYEEARSAVSAAR